MVDIYIGARDLNLFWYITAANVLLLGRIVEGLSPLLHSPNFTLATIQNCLDKGMFGNFSLVDKLPKYGSFYLIFMSPRLLKVVDVSHSNNHVKELQVVGV